MYTLNNPTEEEERLLNSWFDDGIATYHAFQRERGEEGTEHLQGYVRFKTNRRLVSVRKLLDRGHWEVARGSHGQCVEYVTKEESRVAGPWTYGSHECKQGERSDLHGVAERVRGGMRLRQIAEEEPAMYVRYWRGFGELRRRLGGGVCMRDVKCWVYFGRTGTGKTYRCYEEAAHRGIDLFRPIINLAGQVWFQGYDGEEGILFDDFTGKCSISLFLQILDRYPMQVEMKGSSAWSTWKHVWITSNLDPRDWWAGISEAHMAALTRRFSRVEEFSENKFGMG